MSSHNLFKKTEIHVTGITLAGADLREIATVVARTLGVEYSDIFVTDVRKDIVTLDMLRQLVDAERIAGKEKELLATLAEVRGVKLSNEARVHSEGMLGWIASDRHEVAEALEQSATITQDVLEHVKRRAVVFSTGGEVEEGSIKDTNAPFIMKMLESFGYNVTAGGILADDEEFIAGTIRSSILGGGYGLVITTGGVGAEEKDRTVEAVLKIDPIAAVSYVCHYEAGTGRHVKDGVRLAAGCFEGARIITLPGPHDEVVRCMGKLIAGLKGDVENRALVESLAAELRSGFAIYE